eukprot:SM004639S16332  [mRNA]  locus=s4639:76:678:- [translate_table: standard]
MLCDMGAAVFKELGRRRLYGAAFPADIPLPSSLYRRPLPGSTLALAAPLMEGSHLPPGLLDKLAGGSGSAAAAGPRRGRPPEAAADAARL